MDVQLTKDADKLLCIIYKEYLSRRKSGMTKTQARYFGDPDSWGEISSVDDDLSETKETIAEIARAGLARMFIGGGFELNDTAIIYMENRFPNGLTEVLAWLAKFKSAIPFL